jgi:hypothetical protein
MRGANCAVFGVVSDVVLQATQSELLYRKFVVVSLYAQSLSCAAELARFGKGHIDIAQELTWTSLSF